MFPWFKCDRKDEALTINEENFVNVVECGSIDVTVKYAEVFDKNLGRYIFKLTMIATLSFSRPERSFVKSLRRLESLKVIAHVDEPTKWVTQIVVAVKKSGELCFCIDPKPLNAALKRKQYQIPVIDDLLPDLANTRVFSKVDLATAFWHLELDHKSSMLITFATPYGRYCWLCLPFWSQHFK